MELRVNAFTQAGLKAAGFSGFVRVSDLKAGCCAAPQDPGVYALVRNTTDPPAFRQRSIGGPYRGDPTVPISELAMNWVEGAHVVYIGKAGRSGGRVTLRKRLGTYMRFGSGVACAHWGGRFVWQLADCDELLVAWKPLLTDDPRRVEQQLLRQFVMTYGKLPFANLTL